MPLWISRSALMMLGTDSGGRRRMAASKASPHSIICASIVASNSPAPSGRGRDGEASMGEKPTL